MKHNFLIAAFVLLAITGCMKDKEADHYYIYRPVYETKEQAKAGIRSEAARKFERPGKIVVKGGYVFLNDIDLGIHIVDISNPAQPINKGFIPIPGCQDLAVNGNILYADCYQDMAVIDISQPENSKLRQYQENVFPRRTYPYGFISDTTRIIQQWIVVDSVVKHPYLDNSGYFPGGIIYLSPAPVTSGFSSSPAIGIAGSTSRFAQLPDRLYAVSQSSLRVFNTTNAGGPVLTQTAPLLSGDIETIFPYKQNLFIGSQTGVYIYDAQNPDLPKLLSQFSHVRRCDPVIADGNFAFVTLKSTGLCGGSSNEMDILDISDLAHPQLVTTLPLTSPGGLAKEGPTILVCDGKAGLKVFDNPNLAVVTPKSQVTGFEANDVIMYQGIAVVVAADGLYTIDYTDSQHARVIGKIVF